MNYLVAARYLKHSDPTLGQVIERVGACQLSSNKKTSLLQELARAIISQQISTRAAAKIYQRFLEFYTDSDSVTLSAQALLDTPPEQLRSLGISRPKIRYLHDLAQKVLLLPRLEDLETMSDGEIVQTLTQIKGVGCWTVQMLLIFRLNRPDVFPVDDLGIRKAVQKLYTLEELPSKNTLEKFGQKWKPYRSLASWYLWQSLKL